MIKNLKTLRESTELTQKEFAASLGLSLSTYNGYEIGAREPKSDFLIMVAQKYGVTIDYLMGYSPDPHSTSDGKDKGFSTVSPEALKIAKRFDTLDEWGKDVIDTILAKEAARCTAQKTRAARQSTEESREMGAESALYYFPMYDSPMSAGTGLLAGQEPPKTTPLVKEPPHDASYIAPVSGDSMEPTYSDGDLLFIQATPEIEVGQVGVFFMNGQQWVKELGRGRLISHNRAYAPIPMTEDIVCQGLVLGVCDESYFP